MNGESRTKLRKKVRLWAWQVAHFWEYWPEIKWFFWGIRLRLALLLDRLAGRTPLLFMLPVWGHKQHIQPTMDELRRRSRKYSFYLILDQRNDLPKGDLLGVARWRVRPYRHYLPFSKYFSAMLFSDVSWGRPPGKCPLRICLDHGLPAKFCHYTKEMGEFYTHILAYGPLHREIWEGVFSRYPELKGRLVVREVGYPRGDQILARCGKKREALEKFHLDGSKPAVLYAPSFNRGAALDRYGRSVFDALAGMEDVNVIVKLHPVTYDRSVIGVHSNGVYWPDVVDEYKRPGFVHAGNVDAVDCMIAADVLLTDISGIALEYYLLDRPVVYLESPGYYQSIGAENGGGDNLFINVGRPAGVEVGDVGSMCEAIRAAIKHPEEKSPQRQALVKLQVCNPGHGTEAVGDAVERLLAGKPL